MKEDARWASHEFEHVSLGDARLERRLQKVVQELYEQPEYPINQASEDAAATKAAYRFFANDQVTSDKILAPHRSRTLSRAIEAPIVLAIQDTSYLDFSTHRKTEGLGPIGSEGNAWQQGLLMHTAFLLTPHGLPLGIASHRCWARSGFCDSAGTWKKRPLEEKESVRWVSTLREVSGLDFSESTKVVHITDREGDFYDLLSEAQKLDCSYVIRSSHNRKLKTAPPYNHLQEHLFLQNPKGFISCDVPREKRTATLEVMFAPVTFRPPRHIPGGNRETISCWAVLVHEPQAPNGCEPLSWLLLTNVAVATLEDAVERVQWYRRRWAIEEFHRILKHGCRIEACRLQTSERLQRFIAVMSVVAWRIFWMVHVSRANPDAPAEIALTYSEIATLRSLKRFRDTFARNSSLSVRDALVAIACLGGYLNRKNDPPPGPIALWRGWQRLASMHELYDGIAGCG